MATPPRSDRGGGGLLTAHWGGVLRDGFSLGGVALGWAAGSRPASYILAHG